MPRERTRRGLTRRTVRRYLLFQIPDLAVLALVLAFLRHLAGLSDLVLLLVILGWLAKDVALFPLVWRSYADDVPGFPFSPVGERGIVIERLAPSGMVRVQGELWRASLRAHATPLEAGTAVRIVDRQGLVLTVAPWS